MPSAMAQDLHKLDEDKKIRWHEDCYDGQTPLGEDNADAPRIWPDQSVVADLS